MTVFMTSLRLITPISLPGSGSFRPCTTTSLCTLRALIKLKIAPSESPGSQVTTPGKSRARCLRACVMFRSNAWKAPLRTSVCA